MARRRLVAGNWKMNGLRGSAGEFDRMVEAAPDMPCDLLVCPPATLISTFASRAAGGPLRVGGQDCHAKPSGAHTGDLSAEMLADSGAKAVIIGHSERRADHGESDATVADKAQAAWRAGLAAIICVGETEAERDSGDTLNVLARSLDGSVPETAIAENTVIAYEPVWAIGTGRTPTVEQIDEVHAFLRGRLRDRLGDVQGIGMRILYGGSVKASNAEEIFSVRDVDGALVGGASLKAVDFLGVAAVA